MASDSATDVGTADRAAWKQCQVLVVGPQPPPYGGMALQAQLLTKLLRADGCEVVFLPSNYPFPRGLAWIGRMPGLRTVVRSITLWTELWNRLRKVQTIHVLAASWLYFFLVVCPAVIAARLQNKRVVLNYRGGEAKRFFRLWGWAARPFFKLAQVITAPSEFVAEAIRRSFGVPVAIVPNILDTSRFKYRVRRNLLPKILITRHLEPAYDVETALRAFQVVQQRYPAASLLIAGTGSQEQRLRRLVAAWKLENITFLGHVPHEDLPATCDKCDILLNSSRIDNFPNALVEGSAAGLVLVSTSAGGIPYMYRHEQNALLVDPGDWQGLASSVLKLLETPEMGKDLAERALALARSSDWKLVRRPLYRAYCFPLEDGPADD